MRDKKGLIALHVMVVMMWGVAEQAYAGLDTEKAMDAIVTRLYATQEEQSLYGLTAADILAFITDEEKEALSTGHWQFDVNVPVIVSLMRDKAQVEMPFWLEPSGFVKTDMVVRNMEGWTYEVWQKQFDAGRVQLGINGFGNHRPHYFVCVDPVDAESTLKLGGFHPAGQQVLEMAVGALTYHDWTELVLTDVPESLRGQALLPTTRGRAGEAHLAGGFRKTLYPSSARPDLVTLTWSEEPRTTQTVQWRTSDEVEHGVLEYREEGSHEWQRMVASYKQIEDRMLANDRYCHWFTGVARCLKPGTRYVYRVGDPDGGVMSGEAFFTTAPEQKSDAFTFLYFGDTHNQEAWGQLQNKAVERHPDAAFLMIAGDLVGTGRYRDYWDMFFTYGGEAFGTRPVVPCIGNHDAQLGLPPTMYLDFFGLPDNGPEGIMPERAYAFDYGDALFVVLDVMSGHEPQRLWLETTLAGTDAKWKFAMFHFPLYSAEESYPELYASWGTVLERYGVDMVFSGHVHTYLRTWPMRGGERAGDSLRGTVYVTSISIPGDKAAASTPDFAATYIGEEALYQVLRVEGDQCLYLAYDKEGNQRDEVLLTKD